MTTPTTPWPRQDESGSALDAPASHDGRSLADLRHDLQTPIGQVIGYGEILQEEMADAGLSDHLTGRLIESVIDHGRTMVTIVCQHFREPNDPAGSSLSLRSGCRALIVELDSVRVEVDELHQRLDDPECRALLERILQAGQQLDSLLLAAYS